MFILHYITLYYIILYIILHYINSISELRGPSEHGAALPGDVKAWLVIVIVIVIVIVGVNMVLA